MPIRIVEPAADDAAPTRKIRIIEPATAARAAGGRKTSQSLGFMEGVARPIENFQAINPLNAFDMPGSHARQARETARQGMHTYFDQREQTERPGTVGKIAGNILGTLPVMAVTRNPLAGGALQGALLSEEKDPMGVATDAAMGAGLNWLGGKAVEGVADFIKPVIDPAVQRLKAAGVSLTPGMVQGGKAMVREDKRISRPIVGDMIVAGRQKTAETFNTATVNRALEPLGVKVPDGVKPGHDAIAEAKKLVGDAYDAVIPHVSVQLNGQQFAQSVFQAARNLKPGMQKQLQQIMNNELGGGNLAGDALKRAQGEIRRLAGKYSRSLNANENLLGDALHAVDDELSAAMVAQNPQLAPRLQKVNKAYRGYRIVADAASKTDDGVFNTGQLKQSVRKGDFSKNKDATARGQAFMQDLSTDARKVIPSKTPDSGTAGRLQAGNPLAIAAGLADAAAYQGNALYQRLRTAPRSAGAGRAADAVRRLKGPLAAGTVATARQSRD